MSGGALVGGALSGGELAGAGNAVGTQAARKSAATSTRFMPSTMARRISDPCRTIDCMDTTRVDVWLWAVRLYKSRSAATAACRGGHVRVNRVAAKASTPVKVGDRVEAFVERKRILEVVALLNKRVGAAIAATCFIDHSPPVAVVKRLPRVAVREPGSGRPTKRERRELDRFRGA